MATVISTKHVPVEIAARTDYTDALWSIRIRHGGDFPFVPGQYCTLGAHIDGRIVERPYSIVSGPHEPELELYLEKVTEGGLTPALHTMDAGTQLLMRPRAKGLFRLDLSPQRTHHILVATVTGIAPYMSMIRHLQHTGPPAVDDFRVLVLHGSSYVRELAYGNELRTLADSVSWLTYIPTISRPWDQPEWDGECGRVEDILRKYADAAGCTADNSVAYLCGAPGMILVAETILLRARMHKENVRQEQYYPLGKGPAELQ